MALKYCSNCGADLIGTSVPKIGEPKFPVKCPSCPHVVYGGPDTVVVALIPFEGGLLKILRGEEPKGWSLVSGYVDRGETWQQAVVREIKEEVGLDVDIMNVTLFDVETSLERNKTVIIAEITGPEFYQADMKFELNREVRGYGVMKHLDPDPLVFPIHTEAALVWFGKQEDFRQ